MNLPQSFPAPIHPAPGVELVAVRDARFKRALLHLHFEVPLDAGCAARTLLAAVLSQGTARLPGRLALAQALQEAYGAELDLSGERSGECHQLVERLSWVGERFLPAGESILPGLLGIARELLETPRRGDGGGLFDPATFQREQAQHLRRIAALHDDRGAWAEQRFLETMCAGEPYARPYWGTAEEVRALTPQDLESARLALLREARVVAVLVGPADPEPVAAFLARWLGGRQEPSLPPPVAVRAPVARREVREELPCDQARFLAGWRCAMPQEPEAREALALAVSVLGGGVHSRLFRRVREERSQAYSIHAQLRARKGLMTIEAGLDAAHAPSVLAECDAQILDLQAQGPTPEELEHARRGMEDRLRSLGDRPSALAGYLARERSLGLARTPAERLRMLARVRPEEVAAAAARWLPDTVYLLAPPVASAAPVPVA